MPPKQTKRKLEEPKDGKPPELAESEEDEKQPVEMSAQKRAFLAFQNLASAPVPASNFTSGGASTCSIEGVVLGTQKISVQQKGTTAPKQKLTVAVLKINSNGCKDVITTGLDNVAFSIPTKTMEASPDEMAKNKDAKGPVVLDVNDGFTAANYLGTVTASFYIEAPGAATAKGVAPPPVDQITIGTRVLISNITSVYGKEGSAGNRLFCNAKKVVPLTEPRAGEQAASVIAEARSSASQCVANFLLSSTMGGFFGTKYDDPVQQQQADVIKQKWTQFVEGAAAKCESTAMAIGDDPAAAFMHANAARIKEIKPEDAAAGTPIFKFFLGSDVVTPFIAPIVQYGIFPGHKVPDYSSALFDPDLRNTAPASFVEGTVTEVDYKGNLGLVAFKLFFCNNKAAALAAIEEGKSPILGSTEAAVCVKVTKRGVGPEMVGTLVDKKIEMALTEILPFANLAIYAHVFPRGAGDSQLNGHFAEFGGVDFADGIKKVGVAVSEKWLDEHMLGGRGVFIHTHTEGHALVEPKVGCGPSPVLKTNGYQALSEGSFDFDGLRVAEGKVCHFYVIYPKCSKDVEFNSDLANSTKAGESHMKEVVANASIGNGIMKDFLRQECIVYAVGV